MKELVVTEGQSMLDLALQLYGSTEGLLDLCLLNNLSVNERLTPGQRILYDESKIRNTSAVAFYKREFPRVNTGRAKNPDGIGYWVIESDFTVS